MPCPLSELLTQMQTETATAQARADEVAQQVQDLARDLTSKLDAIGRRLDEVQTVASTALTLAQVAR